jgi:hypothetical protein
MYAVSYYSSHPTLYLPYNRRHQLDLEDNEEDADDDLEDALVLYEDDADEIGETSHIDAAVDDDLVEALESSTIE